MITIATLLWDANEYTPELSKGYDESWAEKLYRAAKRHLTQPFRMIVWTERERVFREPIEQRRLAAKKPTFASCIEPYALDEPMILMGLDTIICGNIDEMANYALGGGELAVPRDPIFPDVACNGVALVPSGKRAVMFDPWRNENDMEWVRASPHVFLDDVFPGQVLSWRVQVRGEDRKVPEAYPADMRICYFHGKHKPHTLVDADPWIAEHWR